MRLYVYLDESGSIHKNSNTKYFAVGGYFTFEKYRLKITSLYKKINTMTLFFQALFFICLNNIYNIRNIIS